MTALSRKLKVKLKSILKSTFTVTQPDKHTVLFKSLRIERDEYTLFPGTLTEYEVLEIAKILAEVYSNFNKATELTDRKATPYNRNLNLHLPLSGQLVGTVLSLESSALHKLLLLTSGHLLISIEESDSIICLAQYKKETCYTPKDMVSSSRIFNILKNLYVLPGVSMRTVIPSFEYYEPEVFAPGSFELTARLTAFFANDSEKLTLGEHLKLDFVAGIQAQGSLAYFNRLQTVQRIMRSNYLSMIEMMTAIELNSLTFLLPDFDSSTRFPEIVLRNRSTAMSQGEMRRTQRSTQSVQMYLSDIESKALSSASFILKLDSLVSDYSRPLKIFTPPVIYAALAEVLIVRGERKALDVASELVHLKLIEGMSNRVYGATVALIVEALDPANDDFPFSWVAQMSEHAWVLDSHNTKKDSGRRAQMLLV